MPSRLRARPADVLTPAALSGRVAALDVGVTSPAASTGSDATDDMFERKMMERQAELPELAAQNIVYRPLVWTCFGRPHKAAQEVLTSIAKRVARKRGCHPKTVLKKMEAAISVCIARRAARMSLACWPRDTLHGGSEQANAAVENNFLDDPS